MAKVTQELLIAIWMISSQISSFFDFFDLSNDFTKLSTL